MALCMPSELRADQWWRPTIAAAGLRRILGAWDVHGRHWLIEVIVATFGYSRRGIIMHDT